MLIRADDPLSAVDAHVGRHLFDRVIGPNGLLASKARLLCTNSIPFVQQADELVLIRKGVIIERGERSQRSASVFSLTNCATGTYASAMSTESELSQLLIEFGHAGSDDSDDEETTDGSEETAVAPVEKNAALATKLEQEMLSSTLRQRASQALMKRAELVPVDVQKRDTLRTLKASTRPKEKREQGSVKYAVYKEFIKANSYVGVRSVSIRRHQETDDSTRRSSSTSSRSFSNNASRSERISGCDTGPATTRKRERTATSPSISRFTPRSVSRRRSSFSPTD